MSVRQKDRETTDVLGRLCPSRILMVDDEVAILKPVMSYFLGLGYEVVGAREPEEAEALLEHEIFDLIILDLGLTRFGTEGLAVVRSIREQDQGTPIMVLSAHAGAEIEEEALRAGADCVLRKPQPLAHLAQVVFELIGRRS
jgi:DNA-binding response OmpR family regulator